MKTKVLGVLSICAIISTLFLAGCVTGARVSNVAPPVLVPDESSAIVTFYRLDRFIGKAVAYYIEEDGRNIGALKNATYFQLKIPAGAHEFISETGYRIKVNAKPGEDIFIEAIPQANPMTMFGELTMKRASAEEGESALENLSYIHYTPK